MSTYGLMKKWSLALMMAALVAACAAEDPGPADEPATGTVSMALTGIADTIELDAPAGDYMVVASGFADESGAVVDIVLLGAGDTLVVGATMLLSLEDAGTTAGAIGAGDASIAVAPGQNLHVSIPFAWEGSAPDGEVNVDVDFGTAPTIDAVVVTPAPFVPAGGSLEITVAATGGGELFGSFTLTPVEGGLGAKGLLVVGATTIVTAPEGPGVYTLTVSVSDADGRQTDSDKLLELLDGSGLTNVSMMEQASAHTFGPTGLAPLPPEALEPGENGWTEDHDGDGKPDHVYVDTDGDGVADIEGIDEDEDGVFEEVNVDLDGDGQFDLQFIDEDEDGSPEVINEDTDGDGQFDTFQYDFDGDGSHELEGDDLDGDGTVDIVRWDWDGDGDLDAIHQDTDGDGTWDTMSYDDNGDGVPDQIDVDPDNDGDIDVSWQDANGNGAIDAGEIHDIDEVPVVGPPLP